MTSRSLSLTALSCVLATAGTGCSRSISDASDDFETLLDRRLQLFSEDAEPTQAVAMQSRIGTQVSQPVVAQKIAYRRPESVPPQLSQEQFQTQPGEASLNSDRLEQRRLDQLNQPFSPQHSTAEKQARQQNYWTTGIDAGYDASIGEQSAVTDTDWNQVVSQWKSAIAQLSRISPQNPRYGDAQTKLAIYRTGLSRAEGQYISVVQNRYTAVNYSDQNEPGRSRSLSQTSSLNLAQNFEQNFERRNSFENDGSQVRQWIETGHFSKAEQLLTQAVESKRLTRNGLDYADAVLVSAVSYNKIAYTSELLDRLNQWVSQSPRSSMAYAARSYFTQAYLWEDMALEVGKRPKNCPPTPADLDRLGISAADASIALGLDPNNPLALTSKLRLSKLGVLGEGRGPVEAAFQALTKVSPNSFQAHLEKASYLVKQDQTGSGTEALDFLRTAAAQAPQDSALPMLVPMMHVNIANRRLDYREYLSQPKVWQEIQTRSERVVAQLPEAAPYSALLAKIATTTGQRDLARRYQQIAMNRSVKHPSGQAWPKIMTSM